jgi:ArsR family transcriptional regulator
MLSDTFKIFGDATRTSSYALCTAVKNAWVSCAKRWACPVAISHQLRLLKAIRLVKGRRRGQNIMYSIDDQPCHCHYWNWGLNTFGRMIAMTEPKIALMEPEVKAPPPSFLALPVPRS